VRAVLLHREGLVQRRQDHDQLRDPDAKLNEQESIRVGCYDLNLLRFRQFLAKNGVFLKKQWYR
jgi:hypothetical protein